MADTLPHIVGMHNDSQAHNVLKGLKPHWLKQSMPDNLIIPFNHQVKAIILQGNNFSLKGCSVKLTWPRDKQTGGFGRFTLGIAELRRIR